MNKSDDTKDLFAALAKAQGEMGAAKKDATNPFFKSHYADLASIWRSCQEVLPKHGLAVLQIPQLIADIMVLETVITHASGQWVSGQYRVKPVKDDPQSYGSAMSYARRYSLASMLSIVTEDDDGESAMGRLQPPIASHKPAYSYAPYNGKLEATIGDGDKPQLVKRFFAAAKESGWTDQEVKHYTMTKFNALSSSALTKEQLMEGIQHFENEDWEKKDAKK